MTNIWEIEKMMGLKKLESRHYTGEFFYEGIMSTGDFKGVYDYNRGLLSLKVYQHPKSYPTNHLLFPRKPKSYSTQARRGVQR